MASRDAGHWAASDAAKFGKELCLRYAQKSSTGLSSGA
jgi:hypothetical protein